MTDNHNTHIKIDTTLAKGLVDGFFNASLNSEENAQLHRLCSAIAAGECPTGLDDHLKRELCAINEIKSFMHSELETLAESTPGRVETMLDSHISVLARRDRVASWRRKIIPFASAAASVALLLTLGWNFFLKPSSADSLTTSGITQSEISPDSSHIASNVGSLLQTPADSLPHQQIMPISNGNMKLAQASHRKSSAKSRKLHPATTPKADSGNTEATFRLPDFPEMIPEISNYVAAASIDPSRLIIQPLTTIRQGFSNAHIAADLVSEAFAGISETFAMAGSSLNPQLNSDF